MFGSHRPPLARSSFPSSVATLADERDNCRSKNSFDRETNTMSKKINKRSRRVPLGNEKPVVNDKDQTESNTSIQ